MVISVMSVVALSSEVVWASMGMEIWDVVVLISHVSISMSVVVLPLVLNMVVIVVVSVISVLSVITVSMAPVTVVISMSPVTVVSVVLSVLPVVVNWSKVGVVLVDSMSMVLSKGWSIMIVVINVVVLIAVGLVRVIMVGIVMSINVPWKLMGLNSMSIWLSVLHVVVVAMSIGDGWWSKLKMVSILMMDIMVLIIMVGLEVSIMCIMMSIGMEVVLKSSSVVVVLDVWADIGISMIVEVNLSSVVVWLEVLFVLNNMRLNFMNIRVVLWCVLNSVMSVSMVPVSIVVGHIVVGVVVSAVMGSMKQIFEDWFVMNIVVVVNSVLIVRFRVMILLVLGEIKVLLWLAMVRVLVDILTVVWLGVGSLGVSVASLVKSISYSVMALIPVLLGGSNGSDGESKERLSHFFFLLLASVECLKQFLVKIKLIIIN